MERQVIRLNVFSIAVAIGFFAISQSARCQAYSNFTFSPNPLTKIAGKEKLWTAREQNILRKQMDKAISEYPGLIERCNGINFLRVDQIDHSNFVAGGTLPGCICISDQFFKNTDSQQYRTVIHELVHLADYGFIVSDSKAWLRLSKKLRSAENLWLEPSLQEKLAQKFSNLASEKSPKTVDSEFYNAISAQLLQKNPEVKLFTEYCINGALQKINKRFELAISLFEKAECLIPTSPTPNVNMTYCYLSQKKYFDAFEQSKKAFFKFKKIETPVYEPRYINLLLTQARILLIARKPLHAQAAAELVLSYKPPKNIADQAIEIIARSKHISTNKPN